MQFDPQMSAIMDEVDDLRNTRDDAWQIPRLEAAMLYQIALASGARRIVEVGTSYGFSGLFWAAALKHTGGTLHTIDISQKKYDASRKHFERAGVAEHVTSYLGDALLLLPKMEGPVDIAFLDGTDKESSRKYFDAIWPRIRVGGSVLTDNTKTHPKELSEYMGYVRSLTDAASAELPLGNGVEWTVKLANAAE